MNQNQSNEKGQPKTAAQRQTQNMRDITDATVRAQLARKRLYAEEHWYAVYVKPQHEFQIHDYLNNIEEEMKSRRRGKAKKEDLFIQIDPVKVRMMCYVPVIRQHLKYSDRRVWKEKVQTPGLIFVRCKLDERDPLFHSPIAEYVTGFLNDRTHHHPLPIPDSEMDLFRKAIDEEYVTTISAPDFAIGDKVLIIDGPLAGHVANLTGKYESIKKSEYEKDRTGQLILDSEGNPINKRKITLCLSLNSLLVAQFEIDADKVVKAPKDAKDFEVV